VLRKGVDVSRRNITLSIIVVALLGVLFIFFVVQPHYSDTKQGDAKAQLRSVSDYIDIFRQEFHRLPEEKEGLRVLVTKLKAKEEMLIDPWGQPLIYKCLTPDCASAMVYSKGSDQVDNGAMGDDIAVVLKK
jgi:hypothetical protein